MSFLASSWLLAASAILIPIAIHLWNKRQGKTVKVGSLRWLEASASRRWSSIKLNQVWLLVLRCLIYILLAVALAQPVINIQPQQQEGKKAVFITPELLYSSELKAIKPIVDSLVQRGYTLHRFSPTFEQIPQESWQQIKAQTQDSVWQQSINYWSLLPALTSKYKNTEDSVWLFTSDQQRFYAGTRPEAIPNNIFWIPVATDATASWLQTAVQTTSDSLLLIVGNSSRQGTTYSRYQISNSSQQLSLANSQTLKLQLQNDTILATAGSLTSNVAVQQEPLKVAIHTDEAQKEEVRHLKAAITAIGDYTRLPISINSDVTSADWLFWLKSAPVPESILQQVRQGTKLWVQPSSKSEAVNTSFAGTNIKVFQIDTTEEKTEAANSVWETVNSQALLSEQALGQGKIYTFRSGFSPNWSELGSSAQLPELLLPLLFPTPNATYDLRAVDEQQLFPTKRTPVISESTPEAQQKPLLPWLVLAAFVLFLIERLIATRRSIA